MNRHCKLYSRIVFKLYLFKYYSFVGEPEQKMYFFGICIFLLNNAIFFTIIAPNKGISFVEKVFLTVVKFHKNGEFYCNITDIETKQPK